MVWQAGYVEFVQFFKLFLPSLVNFIIPAFIMSFFIDGSADEVENPPVLLKRGAVAISCLFLVTIMMAISFKQFLKLPPVFGMMFGLSLLQLFGYYLKELILQRAKFLVMAQINHLEYLSKLLKLSGIPYYFSME